MQQERPQGRWGSVPWLAYVLIGVGGVLLVANLGLVGWGAIGRVVGLWPVLLVALGVDLVTEGRYRRIVLAASAVLVLLAAFGLLGGLGRGPAPAQAIEVPLGGATRAEVVVAPGVAELELRAGPPGVLAQGEIAVARGQRLVEDVARDGDTARLALRGERERGGLFGPGERGGRWVLGLEPRVPLELTVDAGVGRSELDLRGLTLERLRVDTGVGAVRVLLPAGSYAASVDTGVGETVIGLPAGHPVRLQIDRGVGGVSVSGELEAQGDGLWVTPGWESAEERLDLRIDGGVGAIRVRPAR